MDVKKLTLLVSTGLWAAGASCAPPATIKTTDLGGMAFQPTNGPRMSSGIFYGTNTFATNSIYSNAEISFPPGIGHDPGNGILLGDFNQIWFSSDKSTARMGYTPHSGAPQLGMGSPRIAIVPGYYVAGGRGALQFGAGSFGKAKGSEALFYVNPSKFPDSTNDPLGYSLTWVFMAGGGYNGNSSVNAAMGFRASASDTNGTAQFDFFDPTFGGIYSANAGPDFNENPGVTTLSIRAGTNANTTGLIYHGSLTHDVASLVLRTTNYAVNFDGTNEVNLSISENLNLTAADSFFPRTNQSDTVSVYITPSRDVSPFSDSSYMLTIPHGWLTNGAFSTNIAGASVMELKIHRQIVDGITNYFVNQDFYAAY